MKLFRIWLAYNRLALPSVLLVSVWDLAVSFSAYSSNLFSPLILEGREEGVGLTFLAFFLQTTQRMQLSWPQVCLFCWQVMQYCSDTLLLECIVKRLEYDSKVFAPMLGVVIVEWKSSWVIKAECWSFCSFKRSCLWLKPSTFCCALGKKMLFCSLLVGGWGGHWSL